MSAARARPDDDHDVRALVLLAGCTVQAEPGWQDTLEQLVRPELLHAEQVTVVAP